MQSLFFDLDGTLTDAGEGITKCIQHALRSLGEPVPDATALNRFVGPPLSESFQVLLSERDRERIASAIAAYRDRYVRIGMYENSLYPGVAECLAELSGRGFRLYMVTSKPHVFAAKVADHFRISSFFQRIHGPELDGHRSNKTELVAHVLTTEVIPPDAAAMIGDRKQDVVAARSNGVYSVGVTWGYGSREELVAAGADLLVSSPEDLLTMFAGF
jgi:phosphoglycolate phosphatase